MPVIAIEYAAVVQSLLAAYQGESNTNARYIAFAVRAAKEGWRGIASLFKAAARAEQIHASHQSRILRQLGGEIDDRLQLLEVGTTLENLKSALAGERREIDFLYPRFLAEARACKDTAAIRTFTWALEAEKTHARLFALAIDLVEIDDRNSWAAAVITFYICPVCGYTSDHPDERDNCPVCHCSGKKFEVCR